MGIKNIAENLGPSLVVAVAMILPTHEMAMRDMMWMERSPEHPAVHVTKSETRKVVDQTGTVRSSVGIRVVAASFDDGREEVLECLGLDGAVLEKDEEVETVNSEGEFHGRQK
jgi:hypothetical protein